MEVTISPAAEADAAEALRFYCELLAENLPFILQNNPPTLEQETAFIRWHDGERSIALIASSGSRVVGMSGFKIPAHHQLKHSCSLNISVAKDFRNRGIGARLIAAGEAWCRSKGVVRLELEVIDGNPAVRLYERLGFEFEGRKRKAFKVGERFLDVIIMAKLLE